MKRWMKVAGGVVGGGLAAVVLAGGGFYAWAAHARDAVMAKTWEVPYQADFPIPFPLTEEEKAALVPAAPAEPVTLADAAAPVEGAAPAAESVPLPDFDAIAKERAIASGKHLVESRLGCAECHGADFAGGTMIDAPPMGTLKGPNITTGGVTKGWTAKDWDRIVRHGIMEDGHTAIMPAQDFAQLSDRELSDVVSYIQSLPPSDAVIPAPTYGPVLTVLIATGQVKPGTYLIDHGKVPPKAPPADTGDAEQGKHLAQSCQGCHGINLSGGPIQGGDPSWPAAYNLTQLAATGWTYEEFDKAVRHGQKKEGGEIRKPMPWQGYAHMSDTEVQAIWAFLQTVPAAETGVH